MKSLLVLILLTISGYGFSQTNEKVVKDIIIKQESDWNKNDIVGYSNSFSEKGVLINFLGFYWRGRTEIASQLKQINECCIKPTSVKLEVLDIRSLGSNTAIAHIKETLTAKEDYQVPGGVVKKGSVNHKFITAIFEKDMSTWKVTSMQVTQIVPLPPR